MEMSDSSQERRAAYKEGLLPKNATDSSADTNSGSQSAKSPCPDGSAIDIYSTAPAINLPRLKIFAFSLGHVLNDLCASCWFTYLLVLMHTVIGLPSWKAGLILLSGQIADAIATPLVGIYSDKTKGFDVCGFYVGRRHLWYFMGTVTVLANFYFLFGRCVLCDILGTAAEEEADSIPVVVYYSIAAALFNVGWASVQVSHMSLIPELTSCENVRVVLNSVRYAATVASNLFVFVVLAILIHVFSMSELDQFHTLALISIGVGTVTSIFFLLGTEERRPIINKRTSRRAKKSQNEESSEDYQSLDDGLTNDYTQSKPSSSSHRPSQPTVVKVEPAAASSHSPTVRSDPNGLAPSSITLTCPNKQAHLVATSSVSQSTHSVNLVPHESIAVSRESDELTLGGDDDGTFSSSASFSTNTTYDSTLLRRLACLPVHFTSWRTWLHQGEYWTAATIYTCVRLIVNASQVCLPFFILNVLELSKIWITILPCTVYLSSLIAAGFMKSAHTRFGRIATFNIGLVSCMIGSIGMIFLPSYPSRGCWVIFPCSILIGAGNGTTMVAAGSLTTELIGSRTNHAAFVFGSFSFGDKFVTGIVLFLIQTFNHDESTYMRFAATIPTIATAIFCIFLVSTKVDLAEWKRKHKLPDKVTDQQYEASEQQRDITRSNDSDDVYVPPPRRSSFSHNINSSVANPSLVTISTGNGEHYLLPSRSQLGDLSIGYMDEPMPKSVIQTISFMQSGGPGEATYGGIIATPTPQ